MEYNCISNYQMKIQNDIRILLEYIIIIIHYYCALCKLKTKLNIMPNNYKIKQRMNENNVLKLCNLKSSSYKVTFVLLSLCLD